MTTLDLDSMMSPRPARVAAAKRGRVTYAGAMKLLRRVHLYSGLFMTPWVFLYGATALLFNHPTAFSDRTSIDVGPAEVAGTSLAQLPRPDDLAGRVVERLAAADPAAGYKRPAGDAAKYAQPLTATFTFAGKPHNLRLDLGTLEGTIREGNPRGVRGGGGGAGDRPGVERGMAPAVSDRADGDESPADAEGEARPPRRQRGGPNGADGGASGGAAAGGGERRRGNRGEAGSPRGDTGTTRPAFAPATRPAGAASRPATDAQPIKVDLDLPAFKGAKEAVTAILSKATVPPTDLNVRFAPELTFAVEANGKPMRARFDPLTGTVTTSLAPAAAEKPPLPTRQFLTNLHKAHGYPSTFGPRWAWALAVDAMFLSMCGWGLSGLLMWWQMKNLRLVGTIILIASAATATAMIWTMHGAMTGG